MGLCFGTDIIDAGYGLFHRHCCSRRRFHHVRRGVLKSAISPKPFKTSAANPTRRRGNYGDMTSVSLNRFTRLNMTKTET